MPENGGLRTGDEGNSRARKIVPLTSPGGGGSCGGVDDGDGDGDVIVMVMVYVVVV